MMKCPLAVGTGRRLTRTGNVLASLRSPDKPDPRSHLLDGWLLLVADALAEVRRAQVGGDQGVEQPPQDRRSDCRELPRYLGRVICHRPAPDAFAAGGTAFPGFPAAAAASTDG
jgi:hypothetical protein